MIRQVKTKKLNEIWFNFNGKYARFGLEEFVLVTGLGAGEVEQEYVIEEENHLLSTYFPEKNKNRKINRKSLWKAFQKCTNQEDKFKLGLLVCLVWVLLGAEENTFLNLSYFDIVADVDVFNNYPWAKESFACTIKNFKGKLDSASTHAEKKMGVEYNIHGFPYAVTSWGLEAIPALGKRFADLRGVMVPRMLSWKVSERLLGQTVDTFLESRKYTVKRTLKPTEEEERELFWQQLSRLDDNEDSVVDHQDVSVEAPAGSSMEKMKVYQRDKV